MILFLHHRYRTTGGEEQAVDNLLWLVRERLGEDAELLVRESAAMPSRRAAAGLLWGGLEPEDVARAVKRTGARIVHAHNLHPTLGWRALAAARAAGAAVVMHLHQYRLVCAIGVCFRDGHECTRCRGRNVLPGIALNCRGSRPEAVAYGAGLMLWQRQLVEQVDAFVVPSHFAESRLRALGAPLGQTFLVPHPIRFFAGAPVGSGNGPALLAARLSPEKGIAVAMQACAIADVPLVVAGDGPERERLMTDARGARFVGRVSAGELAELRAEASLALVPSLSAETFGLAAAEAMSAGLPVAASRIGALPELVPEVGLATAGDPASLAAAIARVRADPAAGERAIAAARAVSAPEVVAPALAAVYEYAGATRRPISPERTNRAARRSAGPSGQP